MKPTPSLFDPLFTLIFFFNIFSFLFQWADHKFTTISLSFWQHLLPIEPFFEEICSNIYSYGQPFCLWRGLENQENLQCVVRLRNHVTSRESPVRSCVFLFCATLKPIKSAQTWQNRSSLIGQRWFCTCFRLGVSFHTVSLHFPGFMHLKVCKSFNETVWVQFLEQKQQLLLN